MIHKFTFYMAMVFFVTAYIQCGIDPLAGGASQQGNGYIGCTVVNPDGSPAVGAQVRLRHYRYLSDIEDEKFSYDTLTDTSGSFSIDNAPFDTYTIEIAASEDMALVLDNVHLDEDNASVTFGPHVLKKTGYVSGEVNVSRIDSQVPVHIRIMGLERNERVSKEGRFRLDGLAPLNYSLYCSSTDSSLGSTLKDVKVFEGSPTFIADQISLPIDYYYDSLAVQTFIDTQGIIVSDWNRLVERQGNRIRSLKLDSMGITVLSSSIGTLPFVKYLNLGYNPLVSLPLEMKELSLYMLTLDGVKMDTIIEGFEHVVSLSRLSLDETGISKLPHDLHRLGLFAIDLNRNALHSFPEPLFECSTLTTLNLQHNAITHLPDSFHMLTNLTRLDVWGNDVDSVGPSIAQLSQLHRLDLNRNGVVWLSNSIGECENLQILLIQNGFLTSLPSSIGELKNITHMDLFQNELQTLPTTITNLTRVTRLSVNNNRLCSLPTELVEWINQSSITKDWYQTQRGCN